MPHMVTCVKFRKEMPGLEQAPFGGDLGQRIYDGVSQEAWDLWKEHLKMIINEYRVDLMSKEGVTLLMNECEKYFFGEGSALPPDFKPDAQASK